MKYTKILSCFISVTLLLGMLTGCGKTTEREQKEEKVGLTKGRFVEEEQQIPDEWEGWTAKQLFVSEEKLHLLMAKEEGERLLLQEWEYCDEAFTDVTENWLKTITLPAQEWMELKLMEGGDNAKYLFAAYVEEDCYRCRLWKKDGESAGDITPEKWTTENEEWGGYEMVNGMATLNDGTLAAYSSLSFDILSGEDGNILRSEQNAGSYYDDNILSDGENLYLIAMNNGGGFSNIEKWKGGQSANAESISFGQNNVTGITVCVMRDGTLISAGADGIFRYKDGEQDWEKLIDGFETDFSLTGCWCTGLAALADGSIYALFHREDGGISLKKYEYDPEAVNEITETLKLFTVEESFLLQNAAALYHREHPEVMIELECAYSYNDKYSGKEPDYNDIYRKLNTMLMGEEAPDILVLDHLDIDSYAEKGLLADLEEVVAPLEADGKLLSNITGAYVREDGCRYVVPMEFGFTFAMGRDITTDNMASIKSLASFLDGRTESWLGAQTTAELVDMFYPYFSGKIVSGGQLDKETLKEYLGYLKIIADNCGIVEKHDDSNGRNGRAYNQWDLASHVKLAFNMNSGFNDCMSDMAIVDFIKGDFTAFENCFTPSCRMSVCSKSEYSETAKDFVRFALSEAVQGTDYYTGFPVNASCLEMLSLADRSNIAACTMIEVEDGTQEEFNILAYSREISDRLVGLCKQLDRPVVEDAKIREVLIDELDAYLKGSGNLDDAVSGIENGLKMYLAE